MDGDFGDLMYKNGCDPHTFNESIKYAEPISIIRIITSISSVIGATSIIIGVFLTGKLSNSEVHPLFTLSVGDFILSCTWIFGGAVWLHGKNTDPNGGGLGLCYVLAIATLILSIITYLLTVVYSIHALIKIKEIYQNKGRQSLDSSRPWWHYAITVLLYVVCWGLPAILVLPISGKYAGLEIADDACWCFVDFFNTRPDNGNKTSHSRYDELALIIASFNGIFFVVSSILIIIMYVFILYLAWKILQLQKLHQVDVRSTKIIKKLIARAMVFVSIFFICGFPAFVGSIIVWSERRVLSVSEGADKTVLFIQAILGPLQGVLNALFYGWSRKEFRQAIKIRVKVRMKSKRKTAIESDTAGLINIHNSHDNYSS